MRHIHPSVKPSDNFSVRLLVSLLLFSRVLVRAAFGGATGTQLLEAYLLGLADFAKSFATAAFASRTARPSSPVSDRTELATSAHMR